MNLPEILPNNAWRGRRCFIVGGGPSLKGFDWSKLRGELVIALNSAAFEIQNPTVCFGADYRWQNERAKPRVDDLLERCGTVIFQDLGPIKGLEHTPRLPGVAIVGSAGRRVWSEGLNKGLIHATHTGAAALNLAYLLGADPIYLLGYDYMPKDGKTVHFHDDYPEEWRTGAYSSYTTFSEEITKLAEHFRRRRVYNVTKEGMSALNCFPKMLWEDVPPPSRRPVYVTGFTADYAEEAAEWAASLGRFSLEGDAYPYKNEGSWWANVRKKPTIIRAALLDHEEVCWVDADARFRRYPHMLDNTHADVAGHWLVRNPRKPDERQLCGGTLYFRGEAGRQFVDWWLDALDECPDPTYGDLEALERTWHRAEEAGMCLHELPPSYCWIFDTHPRLYPQAKPTIEHLQASRRKKEKA